MDKRGEIEKVAGVFDLYELRETAKAIRDLSSDLYVKSKKVDFEKSFEQIQETWGQSSSLATALILLSEKACIQL